MRRLKVIEEEREAAEQVIEREYFSWVDRMWEECKHK
jgi:hypothetical protein